MKTNYLIISIQLFFLFFLISCSRTIIDGPYFATGIKIGEVTQSEAIVWVRLTVDSVRVGNDALMPDVRYKDPETGEMKKRRGRPNIKPLVNFPEGYDLSDIQGATPGGEGMVRLQYKAQEDKDWKQLDWQAVNPAKAFTHQFQLTGLSAGKEYELLVEAKPLTVNKISASIKGAFKTALAANVNSEVNFIVTTGTSYGDVDSETGYKIYSSSLRLDPEFLVHTGDIVY